MQIEIVGDWKSTIAIINGKPSGRLITISFSDHHLDHRLVLNSIRPKGHLLVHQHIGCEDKADVVHAVPWKSRQYLTLMHRIKARTTGTGSI